MKRGPKNSHNDLSPEYIRELFNYDPGHGILTWKKSLSPRGALGKEAGCLDDQQRVKIGIHNKEYFAHRIIWVWMTGQWPAFEIDHEDGRKFNNKWKNLREATPSQNHSNRGPQKNNTSGYKGVCYVKSRGNWIAGIKINGRRKHLGVFRSAEDAHKAYCAAAKKFQGEFAKKH